MTDVSNIWQPGILAISYFTLYSFQFRVYTLLTYLLQSITEQLQLNAERRTEVSDFGAKNATNS